MTMLVDSLPRNYTKVPQHFNDKVYIQPRMIARAKCARGAAPETEPESDTFTGTVCVCVWSRVWRAVCVKTWCCPLQLISEPELGVSSYSLLLVVTAETKRKLVVMTFYL